MEVIRGICRVLENGEGPSAGAYPFRMLRTEYPQRDFALLDTIRAECSKGAALEYWSRARGIHAKEIMAIGDNYNDLEMLRFAGVPVVMGNADECLRAQGWPVTLDCDSSGVAAAIRKYALSNL
jgi:hydroxymethylpyrimidine pyrophosphatase-like HAD family hydrolase